MKSMEEAKRRYEEIPIPEELNQRVLDAVQMAEAKRVKQGRIAQGQVEQGQIAQGQMEQSQTKPHQKIYGSWRARWARGGLAAAAAAAVLFVAGLNTNVAFAEGAGRLPVIGPVARVLTFRSYQTEMDAVHISVEVPSVEMIAADLKGLEAEVNEQIHQFCQDYADEARERAMEYRQAFLDTGGTEEEWAAHNIQIQVWYEVKSQTADFLSLVVTGSENWTSAYQEFRYYNFDLQKGGLMTLEDVLGKDFVTRANAEIERQIEDRRKEGEIFWTAEEGGFSGISEDVSFYLNESGNPVIVFDAYSIAPGSAGRVEFEIPRA